MSNQPYLGYVCSGWRGANASGNLPQVLPSIILRDCFPPLSIAGPPVTPFAPSNPDYWSTSDPPIGVNLFAPRWLK